MAYLLLGRKDRGPFPCYAGEYCGNHGEYEHFNETRLRKGKPRSTAWYTSEQLAAQGMVVLYLRRNVQPFTDGHEPVDGPLVFVSTPSSLKEPLKLTRRQRRKLHSIRHRRHAEKRAKMSRIKQRYSAC